MLKKLFLAAATMLISSIIYAQGLDYIPVTKSAEIPMLKFKNDSLKTVFQKIVFEGDPGILKRYKDYLYFSISDFNNDKILDCSLTNYITFQIPPVGYFFMNGKCFFVRSKLFPFLDKTEKKQTFSEVEYIDLYGFSFIREDDTPGISIPYTKNSLGKPTYFYWK